MGTAIEWTDETWNPIVGCSIVSPGCTNCYAMRVASARTKNTAKYAGLTKPSKAGPVWTGGVRFWEKALLEPLSWKTPRRCFVNSMGDLFHEDAPDEWIDRCFAVMALAPQHQFQILTKRPERMRAYLTAKTSDWETGHACGRVAEIVEGMRTDSLRVGPLPHLEPGAPWWPLPNVWLGVSAERQQEADERIPLLLDTPAAVRFVSCEPLLGPIDLTQRVRGRTAWDNYLTGRRVTGGSAYDAAHLDWVIVGGESGRKARPMHPDWARSLRDQCQAASVAFFFKQRGEWGPAADLLNIGEMTSGKIRHLGPRDDLSMWRAGKARTGRLLDGREWNEWPEARAT